MYSRQELVHRALRDLGVLAAGQAPAAEDYATVDDEVNAVLADLARRDIFVWGDPDRIDDAAAVHIGLILANSVATSFGKPADDAVRLRAEARLRQLRPYNLSGQPQQADYY